MTHFFRSLKISFRFLINIKTYLLLIIGIPFVLIMYSCEEEGTAIGKNILPGDDFVTLHSTDTFSIKAYTMYLDSTETDSPSYSYLGELYDPYFGTTTAGFVSQIRMNNMWEEGSFTVDSVKLKLTFTDVTGNTFPGHILKISEIAEQIYPDTTYYSNKAIPLTGVSVDAVLPELKADTINEVVLTLPNSFGEYIIRDTSMLFHSNSIPDFRSYFKGVQFTLQSAGDPVFLALSLEPPNDYGTYENYFILYLSDEEGTQSVFFFLLDAKARNACYNIYSHDLTTAQAEKKIQHINDGYPDTLTYQQCLDGVFTKFTIPGLEAIKNDPSFRNIKVNKARITWPVYYDGDDYIASKYPSKLFMGYTDSKGSKYIVHDYFVNAALFGGSLDSTARAYTFNIAYYVQQFLDDETDDMKPELQLILPTGSVQNAIMKANNSSEPVKLDLTYTQF